MSKNQQPKKPETHDEDMSESDELVAHVKEQQHGSQEKKQTSSAAVSDSAHSELKELIEKNIKWSQVIYNQNKKIKRRMTMLVVGNYLRLVLIIVPIILGIIYLPSLLGPLWEQYGSALGLTGDSSAVNVDSLIKTIEQNTGVKLDQKQIQDAMQHQSSG